MADVAVTPAPPRPVLRERLRPRLTEISPTARVVAEDLLGVDSPIDFVCVESSGRVVLVLVADEGRDLEGVGRALAQRTWVKPRVTDWIQLAPDLGARPDAGVHLVLLCASIGPETRAAAAALGDEAITLVRYRCLRNGTDSQILLEPLARPSAPPPPAPDEVWDLPEPSGEPAFRTGLTDEDLGLSPQELRELE